MAQILQIDASAYPLYLKIPKGADFAYDVTIFVDDTDETPVDLTGCTFSGSIRKTFGSAPVADFSFLITDAVNGKLTWFLTAEQTAAIQSGDSEASAASKYVFTMNITYADSKIAALLSGPCVINPGATYA